MPNNNLQRAIKTVGLDKIRNRFNSLWVPTKGGCWSWKLLLARGYGRMSIMNFTFRAHRVSYFIHYGIIDQNLLIDHICRNKSCVNPDHLRMVDHKTNALENNSGASFINKNKMQCIHGHPLSGENLYIQKSTGFRYCKECNRKRSREWQRAVVLSAKRKKWTSAIFEVRAQADRMMNGT